MRVTPPRLAREMGATGTDEDLVVPLGEDDYGYYDLRDSDELERAISVRLVRRLEAWRRASALGGRRGLSDYRPQYRALIGVNGSDGYSPHAWILCWKGMGDRSDARTPGHYVSASG